MDGFADRSAETTEQATARLRDPADFAAKIHLDQGTELLRRRQFVDAEYCLREAIRFRPEYPDALNNLGTAVWHQGRVTDAEVYYRRALRLNPTDFAISNNLGNVLWDQRRADEASHYYRHALQLRPDSPETRMNLGVLLANQGKYAEATALIQESLDLRPDSHEALDNLGSILAQQGRWDEALPYYDRALGLKPDYPEAHRNRSYAWLARGDFERGWPEYEWRTKCRKHQGMAFDRARWQGEDLAGKTILLHAEQGLGDTLQFIRFVPLVKKRGRPRIVVQVPLPLSRLVGSCRDVDQVVTIGSELADFHVHASLMSLPALLGTTLDSLPSSVPYLSPDRAAVARWRPVVENTVRRRMGHSTPRLTIGVAWQGNPLNRVDRLRSFALAELEPLADLAGVCLVSLQKGHGTEQIDELGGRFSIAVLRDENPGLDDARDFLDTAAVISHVDLVVTPETSVAHLAGSLGVPVWVALSKFGDWRWQLARDQSPWYPTMRLFRQTDCGNWLGVFSEMADALNQSL